MFSKRTTLAVSAGLTIAVCSTALAGNPFKGLTGQKAASTPGIPTSSTSMQCRRPAMVSTSRCSTPAWCRTGATTVRKLASRRNWAQASISRCRSAPRRTIHAESRSGAAGCGEGRVRHFCDGGCRHSLRDRSETGRLQPDGGLQQSRVAWARAHSDRVACERCEIAQLTTRSTV